MKKGSLQLSINAIVIIILAITLLGLGLTFMRQFIGAGTENLYEIFESVDLENPATPIDPLTIERIVLESGDDPEAFFVGFYCNSASTCEDAKFEITECVDKDGTVFKDGTAQPLTDAVASKGMDLSLVSVAHDVEQHKSVGFRVLLSVNLDAAKAGNIVCKTNVGEGNDWAQQEQIIMTVV